MLLALGCGDDTTATGGGAGGSGGETVSSAGSTNSTGDGGGTNDGGGGGSTACTPGAEEACYTGPNGTEGVGLCRAGTRTCLEDSSGFGDCEGEVTPANETCATADDEDCDGLANEEGDGCVCVPGTVDSCYSGPAGTQGIGLCVAGSHTCEANGLGFGACRGEVTPVGETCGVMGDEDCDGATNEEGADCLCVPGTTQVCYSADPATVGVGPCSVGLQTCNGDGLGWGPCNGEVTPTAETCNTPVDDDCDGDTNEEGLGCVCLPNSLNACYTGPSETAGVGICAAGTAACNEQGTALGTCVGDVLPELEACNTPDDDDCDGDTNEEGAGCVCPPNSVSPCYTGPPGTLGVGVCAAGTATCNDQGTALGACTGDVVPAVDSCATLADEDCNGTPPSCPGDHLWSKRLGNGFTQYAESVAADAAGNWVITGTSMGQINFGGGPITSTGGFDIFVAKFDTAGNHVWSKVFASLGDQFGKSVATDGTGNVVVAGQFAVTINFGGSTLTSAGAGDVFLAKLDAAGNHLWSKRFGGAGQEYADSVATDTAGNVIVMGQFTGTVDFGGGPLTSATPLDVFVAKFDPAGNHLWSRRFGETAAHYRLSVATDAAANVVVTGSFDDGSIDFGGGPLAAASADVFVAKLDAAGNHLWSKRFGNTNGQYAGGVSTDAAGNVVVAGYSYGTVDFGGGALTSAGSSDIFVAKLDAAGEHLWSRRFGDASGQAGLSVTTDGPGNVAVTGYLQGTVDFGGGVLTSAGSTDIFVAKLDASGNHLWSKRFGNTFIQDGDSVAMDATGSVAVFGRFEGTIDFGGGPLVEVGNYDMFLLKLAP